MTERKYVEDNFYSQNLSVEILLLYVFMTFLFKIYAANLNEEN